MKKSKKLKATKKRSTHKQRLAAMATEVQESAGLHAISSQAVGYKTKLSDLLLEYAKPLTEMIFASELSEIEKDSAAQEALEQVAFFWNLAFLPYEEASKKLFSAVVSPFNTYGLSMEQTILHKRKVKPVFDMMYERKQSLFSDDPRFVVKTDIHCQALNISFNVASLDINEHPYLPEIFDQKPQ
ncbi:hypothetical protein [Candidatus Albibeggiatoa sp. nov. NOAA]|uniref:hypothetical protein n=1 Tax=Candidatus Albibeggiatoa sp. nov. NOAA TaxID=3162724 RepID=UPI0032F91F91|nr:hypothetical protein [Thiotrichaceae bacterium]